ncbi:endonuclease/exonuclease/phosphatase family protein [Bernardetia sp.]|uniref:endonuclease/exonuclease/phosphatase family protein n=1 Tax=Bernardetia sp. TaxID=1937974 RepID=UPI0025C3DF76|nr:endonuclease/exonuclease/phosphatase family protein [Bernardetia sp.]
MLKKFTLSAIAHLFLVANFISLLPIWLGDLFSHFRMFWTLLSLFLFVIYFLLLKQGIVKGKLVGIVFFSLFINFVASQPFWTNSQTYSYLFLGSPDKVEVSEETEYEIQNGKPTKSLLLMNVLSSNTNYEEVKRTIKNTNADFIVILELNQRWKKEFEELKTTYPYNFLDVREDNFGMGVYSKQQFQDSLKIRISQRVIKVGGEKEELDDFIKENSSKPASMRIDYTMDNLTLLVTHPIPPINWAAYKERNGILKSLANIPKKNSSKTLLVGDFNCSPFSADYKNFLAKSTLKDSQENFGFQPTWNTSFPFLMQTQLDHVWHSKEIEILHRQTLPIKGSDHKAVYVVFR